ncbi:uncharacterized protein LOC127751240 [Frankliniella occidentalis]|uniref:Uncharacterized protein LOC113215356 n=1 Tax=Frankliniella occidentalis TaxID=133901 RepID=A0A6J1TBT5_FRAOC|nr:uncharacterized protein LOC113215356 [Frankliniella occidentalis]XP_052130369.1 uncharacterized protein LOC127751240 [Frankliniella occidentalis]
MAHCSICNDVQWNSEILLCCTITLQLKNGAARHGYDFRTLSEKTWLQFQLLYILSQSDDGAENVFGSSRTARLVRLEYKSGQRTTVDQHSCEQLSIKIKWPYYLIRIGANGLCIPNLFGLEFVTLEQADVLLPLCSLWRICNLGLAQSTSEVKLNIRGAVLVLTMTYFKFHEFI